MLYKEFADTSVAASEMVRYLGTLMKLINIKKLIFADREGNWEGHLQAIKDMITVFLSNRKCKLSTILLSLS